MVYFPFMTVFARNLVGAALVVWLAGCASSPDGEVSPDAADVAIADGAHGWFPLRAGFELDDGRRLVWSGRWGIRVSGGLARGRTAGFPVVRGLPGGFCGMQVSVLSNDPAAPGVVSRPACLTRTGVSADELRAWLAGKQAPDPGLHVALEPRRGNRGAYLSNASDTRAKLFVRRCDDGRPEALAEIRLPAGSLGLRAGTRAEAVRDGISEGARSTPPGEAEQIRLERERRARLEVVGPMGDPDDDFGRDGGLAPVTARQLELTELRPGTWSHLRECEGGERLGQMPGVPTRTSDIESPEGSAADRGDPVSRLALAIDSRVRDGRLDRSVQRDVAGWLEELPSGATGRGAGETVLAVERTRARLTETGGGPLDPVLAGLIDRAVVNALGVGARVPGGLADVCTKPPDDCDSAPIHVDATHIFDDGESPDGSEARPYRSISAALDAVRAGEAGCAPAIVVAGGLYREDLIDPPSVRLRAAPGGRPVLLGRIALTESVRFALRGVWLSGAWDGPALRVGRCADVQLDGSRIVGAHRYGIHQTGGRLALADTDVLAVRRSGEGAIDGVGLYQQAGRAELNQVRFRFNSGPAIVVEGSGSVVEGAGVTVHESGVRLASGTPELRPGLGAVEAGAGARIVLRHSALSDNDFMGLFARSGGSITFVDGSVARTRRVAADTTEEGGFGAYAVDGTVYLEGFTVSESGLCGIAVALDGDLDARSGVVEENGIGACVGVPDYDLERLIRDVQYRDNRINLDTVELPIPDTGL